MTDRIPCINPTCRRTAARDPYPNSSYIICGKCWNALPARLRVRHKQLNRRSKRFSRLIRKPPFADALRVPQWRRIEALYDEAWAKLNTTIINFFTKTEQPLGIEEFLKENGIG